MDMRSRSSFASKFREIILHTFLDDLELNLEILDCLITQKWDQQNVHYFGFKWPLIHLIFVYWAKKYLNIIWMNLPSDFECLAWLFDG